MVDRKRRDRQRGEETRMILAQGIVSKIMPVFYLHLISRFPRSLNATQPAAIHLTEEPTGTFQFLTTALSSEAVYRKSK